MVQVDEVSSSSSSDEDKSDSDSEPDSKSSGSSSKKSEDRHLPAFPGVPSYVVKRLSIAQNFVGKPPKTPKEEKKKSTNPLAIPEDSSDDEEVETDEDVHKRVLFEQKAAHLAERIF